VSTINTKFNLNPLSTLGDATRDTQPQYRAFILCTSCKERRD